MRVNVTQKNIDEAKRGSIYTCPVALALTDAYGQEVWAYDLFGFVGTGKVGGYIPDYIVERIKYYDATRIMVPFEFEVKISNVV